MRVAGASEREREREKVDREEWERGWVAGHRRGDPYKEGGTRIGRLNPRKPRFGSSYLSSPRIKGESV